MYGLVTVLIAVAGLIIIILGIWVLIKNKIPSSSDLQVSQDGSDSKKRRRISQRRKDKV